MRRPTASVCSSYVASFSKYDLILDLLATQGKTDPVVRFPSDFVPLFAREFPERAHKLPKVPADLENVPQYDVDPSATEAVLGFTFRGPREIVLETARWLIDSGADKAWEVATARY